MNDYQQFLRTKQIVAHTEGIPTRADELPTTLFPFQRAAVAWALGKGRAALFEDTGLGKTRQQIEWAWRVHCHTGGNVLILAPLAVTRQTEREGRAMGVPVTVCRSQEDVRPGVNVANYERLHLFDASTFVGIVADESSILKSYDGATRKQIQAFAADLPYRLACTATPAPNDHMELGTHAEFLGVMSRVEMLATFFCHDGGDTSVWRLKGHAESAFWKWVSTWAIAARRPSDMGFEDDGYILPALTIHRHPLPVDAPETGDTLFAVEALTMSDQRAARRGSLSARVAECAAVVNAEPAEPWLIWCDLNDEAAALVVAIPGAVNVQGSDSPERKEQAMVDFAEGRIRVMVSKSSICGFGMNFQHCARVAFVGVTHSYESFYQAVRRCWRYGQTREVACHVIYAETEGAVVRNLERKERGAETMRDAMKEHMTDFSEVKEGASGQKQDAYTRQTVSGRRFTAHQGDCVEVLREMETESIDYSIFSPPFGHSLYTYSNSERDMGNGRDYRQFARHYSYLARELYRVMKAGRLVSFHCMLIPLMKERDGVIGLFDFRGSLIRMMERAGFVYHSEVVIWKDPVTAMQRTKALGLLHKTIRKDSAMSRQGIPDYLVTMRNPGVNPEPISHTAEDFPVSLWQRYASPVWFDINPSRTLQRESAREDKDERHICPLQLDVIERAVELWTNPNDLVLSPFAGIGSEGHVALGMGRRFVGVELKSSYFAQAVANLRIAEENRQMSIFDVLQEDDSELIEAPSHTCEAAA